MTSTRETFERVKMMDFEKRLERAISRRRNGADFETTRRNRSAAYRRAISQRAHARCRLELSEQIEAGLRKLADYFPVFASTRSSATMAGAPGSAGTISPWGLGGHPGLNIAGWKSLFGPLAAHIIELVGKGTIRNKELFHRNHFQFLTQVIVQSLRDMCDLWVLEYAET